MGRRRRSRPSSCWSCSTCCGADSAELKLTVPEGQTNATVRALGIDPLDARVRQVFFFDTPDLTLNAPASSFARAGSRTRPRTRS